MSDERDIGSLADARAVPGAAAIFEGDWGGQIYLVAPAARIACDEDALARLLAALDEIAWPGNDPSGRSLRYERLAPGERIPGGMGGAVATEEVWIHPELAPHTEAIRAVLAGRRASLAE
jgi:hypothetical protein